MQKSAHLLVIIFLAILAVPGAARDQNHSQIPPKILTAKSAYFDNQSGVAAVGDLALARLKKWGRFQVVDGRKNADLIVLLSVQKYGGYIVTESGQTATVDQNGNLAPSEIPIYKKPLTDRDAYLTVIDPKTGENLWSGSRRWGGLLTGFNSAGRRLIDELRKQMEK